MDTMRELERLDEELAFKIMLEGKENICYILKVLENPDNRKKYIIYTDGSKNELGMMEVLASAYRIENGNIKLDPILDDAEWDFIDTILEQEGEEDV